MQAGEVFLHHAVASEVMQTQYKITLWNRTLACRVECLTRLSLIRIWTHHTCHVYAFVTCKPTPGDLNVVAQLRKPLGKEMTQIFFIDWFCRGQDPETELISD